MECGIAGDCCDGCGTCGISRYAFANLYHQCGSGTDLLVAYDRGHETDIEAFVTVVIVGVEVFNVARLLLDIILSVTIVYLQIIVSISFGGLGVVLCRDDIINFM